MMAVLLGVVCAFTEANMEIMTRANGQYAFIMLYNIVYGFTWGPMPWLLPGLSDPWIKNSDLRANLLAYSRDLSPPWPQQRHGFGNYIQLDLQLHHRHGLT